MSDQVEVHNEFEGGEREWKPVEPWVVSDRYAWAKDRKAKTLVLTREDAERVRTEMVSAAATAWHERPLRGRECLTGDYSMDEVIKKAAKMPLAGENHPDHPGKKRFSVEAARWLAEQLVEIKTTAESCNESMDDSCELEMTLRKEDLARFAPFVIAEPGDKWIDDDTENTGLVNIRAEDADYGWYREREAAAKAGIPFYGTHESAYGYSPSAFVSLDGEMIEMTASRGGTPVVTIGESMKPDDRDMAELRAYHAKLKAVKKLFGEED